MNKKTILISNYSASFRPFEWLALSVLSLVFSSPVFAAVWLNEDYSNYAVNDQVSTVNTQSLVSSVPAVNVIVDVSGNKKLQYNKPAAAAGTATLYKLSDSSPLTDRPQGYFSFRATIGATVTGSSFLSYILASNDNTSTSSAAASFLQIRLYNANPTSNQLRIYSGNGTSSPTQVWPASGYLSLPAGENYFQVWYNKTQTSLVFINPSGVSNTLPANSFAVFINNAFYGANTTAANLFTGTLPSSVTTPAGPVSTIGRMGWQSGSASQPYDVTFDNIYAADSAPSGITISSSSTATAQAGYPFSYQIATSGGAATSYDASNLPSYLFLNTTTGVISGTVPLDASPASLPSISISATGAAGTATGSLTLTITAPPIAAPTFTSAATASGFLTRAFTYQIATSTTSPFSTPTSYAIATGTLPVGLNLNTATGLISGTPTELTPDGGTQITYTATNPFGTSNAQTLTITINPAPVFTWNNTSTVWNNASSWTNGVAPANSATTDIAAFGNLGASATSVDVGTGRSIGGIVFNSGAYAYTWTGTDITVGGTSGITNNSTAIQTFGNKILNTGANPTWTSVSGGAMVFSGGIDLGTTAVNRTVTFAGAGNVTVSGTIANGGTATAGNVTFSSTGTNLLSGNNTYGGATTINAGSTLKIGNANALGSTSGSTVVSSGGVLDLNGQTISGEPLTLNGSGISTGGALINSGDTDASWSGTVALGSAATYISASAGKKITLSGVVSGATRGIDKIGPGILELTGTNTYTGLAEVADGTMILSAPNSATSYKVQGYDTNIFPVLKVSAINAMSSSATVVGSSSITKTGTLEFATNGNYTLSQYNMGNISFTNSSGSPTTLTFTNLTNFFSTAAGRTLANKSTDLTITFNGQMDIGGSTDDVCKIEAFGPVVISNSVFNSSTSTRGLEKSDGAGTLTMYGVNNYNGTTTVLKGTLSIPTGGSLTSCGNTIVKGSGTSTGNSASLNLAGEAGVVQVSTNGFVRGGGSITSLQVQEAGTVEVAVVTTWITGGTIDFATDSKVSVTGTPITGNTYTLMTASAAITGTTPILVGATGWSLRVTGSSLYLEEASVADGYAAYLSENSLPVGTAFDAMIDGVAVGLKYAFGSANGMPQNNGVTAVPVIAQLPNGDQQMTYTFDVKEDSALTVTYQTSSDLVNWTTWPADKATAVVGAPTGFLKKQVEFTSSGKLFIRINVTR
jgi:autotransporter-associated beta strand protein